MYSFGRLNPYNPFVGGFVHEYVNKGTFKRFKKTKVKILKLSVTKEQYEIINNKIKTIEKNKNTYGFNTKGLFMVWIKKEKLYKNKFYCAQFVRYLLEAADVKLNNVPRFIAPDDFKKLSGAEIVYEGKLQNYKNYLKKQRKIKK